MDKYRDENGHWTTKENDGGKCTHQDGIKPKTDEFDATTDDDFKLEEPHEKETIKNDTKQDDKPFDETTEDDFKTSKETSFSEAKKNIFGESFSDMYIDGELAYERMTDEDRKFIEDHKEQFENFINKKELDDSILKEANGDYGKISFLSYLWNKYHSDSNDGIREALENDLSRQGGYKLSYRIPNMTSSYNTMEEAKNAMAQYEKEKTESEEDEKKKEQRKKARKEKEQKEQEEYFKDPSAYWENQKQRVENLSLDDIGDIVEEEEIDNYENESKRSTSGGYSGYSKSNRAIRAEDDNQFPKTKWSKKKIQDLYGDGKIELSHNEDVNQWLLDKIDKLSDKEIKDNLIEESSWHHTGALMNPTTYYGLKPTKDIFDYLKQRFSSN